MSFSSIASARRRGSSIGVAAAALGLLTLSIQPALADTVTSTSAEFQVVSSVKNLTVPVDATKTVTLVYSTADPNDSKNGCNLTGSGSKLVLNVQQTPVAPTSGNILELPATVTFNDCAASLSLNVKALQPGSSTVSLSYASSTTNVSGVTAANFNLSGATFRVNVPVVDSTPPSIGYSLSPVPNGNGWNNTDTLVHWTVSDAQSAVTSTTGCADTTISANTPAAGTGVTCSATSAGGTASQTATVKLDKTAPSVTPVVTGATGTDGWYTGDVTVGWSISDGGSSAIDTQSPDCSGATLTSDTSSQSYSCTVTDKAGNSTTASTTVKRDATKPVITRVVSGTPGLDGWFRSDVGIDWTVSDTTSGVPAGTCPDVTVTDDADATSYACDATDNASNTAHDAVSVKKDATAPTATPHVVGTEGDNGWYTDDVVVTWTLADNLAGVGTSTGCGSTTVDADTTAAGQTITCTVDDKAGNQTTESVTVKRDATKPTVGHDVVGTEGDGGWYTSAVGITWSYGDGASGVATAESCDPVTTSADTDETTYTCTVTDFAGNVASDPVVVKVDTTAPVITPHVNGSEGNDGWFVGDVALTWGYSDGSGRPVDVVSGCAAHDVTTDTAGTDFSCSVKDAAGNPASRTVTIKRDATAPTVDGDYSGTAGKHGWYTGTGDVTWTLNDGTSGLAAGTAEGCDPSSVTAETSGETFTCTVSDQAGNHGEGHVDVKVDMTAPVIEAKPVGTLGANNWYVGDVNLGWDVTDTRSGMADGTTSGCGDSALTSDTSSTDFTCTAEDAAGNSTGQTVTLKRDATKPVITKSVSGDLGANGWYTSDVTVDWTVTDDTAGVADDCTDDGLTHDAGPTVFACHAVDNAGNHEDDSVTLKRDATAPTIDATVAGTKGSGDWFTGDVTVDWTVGDGSGSGIAGSTGCGHQSVTADTAGVTFTCKATDEAGNQSEKSVVVKRDATAPSASAQLLGTLGANGWYTSDVTVKWTTSDNESGIDTGLTSCGDGHRTSDTNGAVFSCTTTDQAGNTHTDSVTVKRDTSAPVLTWTGGPADGATYVFGSTIPTATCSATDATSGVTAAGCTVSGGGTSVGAHGLTASATDKAGNVGLAQRTYTVGAWTKAGFFAPVDMGAFSNTVKGGSTVPLKFKLFAGTTELTDVAAIATFTTSKVSCDGTAPEAPVEIVSTGGTSLRYDATGGQFIQNWKTPTGAGSCYRATMTAQDGSSISALFKLK